MDIRQMTRAEFSDKFDELQQFAEAANIPGTDAAIMLGNGILWFNGNRLEWAPGITAAEGVAAAKVLHQLHFGVNKGI